MTKKLQFKAPSVRLKVFTLVMSLMVGSLFGQFFTASKVVNTQKNMQVDVHSFPVGDSVNITITGPSNVWFAFGFGSGSMANTYAIVVDGAGNVSERKLANHAGGSLLASSLTSSSSSVAGSVRTVNVKRTMTGMNANYFSFPTAGSNFAIIWAYGGGAAFGSHANRGGSLLAFSPDCSGSAVDVSVTSTTTDLTANLSNATYQWLDCSNGFAHISGETSQTFMPNTNGNYAVLVTDGSCSDTSACFSISTIGVAENSFANEVNVFPNPTASAITIELGEIYTGVNVVIKDLSGRQLSAHSFEWAKTIDLDLSQNAGLYILEVSTDSGQSTSLKVMVK